MNQQPWITAGGGQPSAPPGWGSPPPAAVPGPGGPPPTGWNPPAAPAGWSPPGGNTQPGGPPAWSPPMTAPQQWAQPAQPQQAPQQAPQQPQPQQWAQPQQPQQAPQWAPPAQPQYQQAPQGGQWAPQQPPQQNWGGQQQAEDPFAGLDTAMPEGQRGEFFEEGSFHIRIEKVTVIQSRKNKQLYTIECEVIQSDCPEQPAGTRCTGMVDLSNRDMRDKNLLTFLSACMGYDPGTFARGTLPPVGGSWSNLARMTVGADQPLRGRELAVRVVARETRAGGEFTDLGWLPKHMLAIGAMRAPKPVENEPGAAFGQEWGGQNAQANGAQAAWGPNPGAGPAGAWAPQTARGQRAQAAQQPQPAQSRPPAWPQAQQPNGYGMQPNGYPQGGNGGPPPGHQGQAWMPDEIPF